MKIRFEVQSNTIHPDVQVELTLTSKINDLDWELIARLSSSVDETIKKELITVL